MLSQPDIHRAAHVMLHEFGNNAELAAAHCANQMLWCGNSGAALNWFQICRTIAVLRQTPATLPN